jgi:hypothetical protein
LAGLHIVYKCLTIPLDFFIKPPSSLGKQTVSQATFALPEERSLPFHKKDLNKEVIFTIIALEKIKRKDGIEKLKSTRM